MGEIHTKNPYLESYSRQENITNIEELTEVVQTFLEHDLGCREVRNVEIQQVHRVRKSKDGNPCPILARFLRYKDCQQIFLLGHRLKGTKIQMFQDLPQDVIACHKAQIGAYKDARKSGVAASSSQSQLDKLFIRGKLLPIRQKFIVINIKTTLFRLTLKLSNFSGFIITNMLFTN